MARSKEFEESVVLDKAMRLFWEQGYEKTSMADLVNQMGIHRRSLYDTFVDKHTLFLKAVELYDHKTSTALAARVKRSKTATEALQSIVALLDLRRREAGFWMLNREFDGGIGGSRCRYE